MHNAYSPAVYYKHSFLFAHDRHLPDSMPPCIPEKPGSSPKSSIILWLVALGGGGGFPPPVFLCSLFSQLRSFLASPRIARHFSLTSFDVLLATPSAFTRSHIVCQTSCFLLFVNVLENFSHIVSTFCSANSKIKAHSAAEKLDFLTLLLPILIFKIFLVKKWEKTGFVRLKVSLSSR